MPMNTILLVEDNPGDAELARQMLAELGAHAVTVVHVSRLSASLEYLGRHHVDAVLLDLSLPDSFGLDTLKRMRAAAPDVPIVVVSGYSDTSLEIEPVQEGAQDYLIKGQWTAKSWCGPSATRSRRFLRFC